MIKIIYAMTIDQNQDMIHKMMVNKSTSGILLEVLDTVDTQALMACDVENTIIIARGINYLTLSKRFKHARVVELAVTGYDIMRGINECQKLYKAKKIAIILSETIKIEKTFLESILDVKLAIFPVKDHTHVANVYEFVKQMGFDAILSGFSVYRLATRDKVNCVRITMGYESNNLAINEAFSVAHAIIEERKKNELFRIILENTNDGVIAVDNQGVIMAYNTAIFEILNLPANMLIKGKDILFIFPKLNEADDAQDKAQTTNVLKTINNKVVVINKRPIRVDDKTLGTVLIIQNVDALQKTEIDIRQKLNKKGLVAKYDFTNLVGSSEAIAKTINIAQKYAMAHSNVLIIGETGTGKELFAQSIHKKSSRRNQPFVAINCAALPEQLLESELFGYVEGAFTGATKGGKVGLFELAHRGTLFLDEIAELPLGLQAKLLRVLQEQEIRKLGDDKIIPVDVRIIAASNVDLRLKVESNQFRKDLLYRLDILSLSIPPLRERKNDIKDIAYSFLTTFSLIEEGATQLTDEAIIELVNYDWPGNIRELRNVCERLMVLSTNNVITGQDVREILRVKDLTDSPVAEITSEENGRSEGKRLTRQEVAEMLGISRTTLWRKTRKNKGRIS